MSLFQCDLCPRSYRYNKNLKRHVREVHRDVEYWLCVQDNCVSKFVRRSYLSKHLVNKHGFEKLEAHATACVAPRGDVDRDTYYDKVSEDDSVLDMIEEMDAAQYGDRYMNTITEFKIPDLNNNSISSCEATNGECAVNRFGAGYSDISDEEVFDCELIQNDNVNSGGSNNGSVVSEDGEVLSCDDGVIDGNSDDVSVSTVLDYNDDVANDTDVTDSVNSYGGVVVEDAVDAGDADSSDDNDDNDDDDDDDDDVIVISSDDDDETAVVIREEEVITETMVVTVTKKTYIVNGGVVDVKYNLERDYYRN